MFINDKDYQVDLSIYQKTRTVLMRSLYNKPHALETLRHLIEDEYNIGVIENFDFYNFDIIITPSEQFLIHYTRSKNIHTTDRSTLNEIFKPIFRKLIEEYQHIFTVEFAEYYSDIDPYYILKRIYDEYDPFVTNVFNASILVDKILLRL